VLQAALPTVAWKNFFASHNVRIHSNSSDLGMSHHVHQSMALAWQGGLNLRTEVSFDYGPSLKVGGSLLPFDVFFVWGPYMEAAFRDSHIRRVSTLVTCGYPFDYLFEEARRKGISLRRELQEAGAKKILCFFDTSFSTGSFTSSRDVQDVYRALLVNVLANPFVGLVIKPKNILDETVLGSSELEELLERSVKTGRCKVMGHKSAMHWVSPCDAALTADLTIGYPINSAVIEGVLAGVPGVHIDLTKNHEHFFYGAGYRQIVFDDLDEAMDAINRWIRNPPSEPRLGDHTAIIDQIDPFRDGKAARRMGQYIAWLLEGFDRRLSRHEAICRASRLYAQEYGARHVTLAPRLGQQ
jgi:hypothetical protein